MEAVMELQVTMVAGTDDTVAEVRGASLALVDLVRADLDEERGGVDRGVRLLPGGTLWAFDVELPGREDAGAELADLTARVRRLEALARDTIRKAREGERKALAEDAARAQAEMDREGW
jgi:hypothetical protein